MSLFRCPCLVEILLTFLLIFNLPAVAVLPTSPQIVEIILLWNNLNTSEVSHLD